MALRPKYGKGFLNALFHTSALVDVDPDEERNALIDDGVLWGVSASKYFEAFETYNYVTGNATQSLYNKYRQTIDASECWETEDTDEEEFEYTVTSKVNGINTTTTKTVTFSGWKVVRKGAQSMKYPLHAYLALFTTMPDENGMNYVEPMYDTEGNETSYIRVDLHKAIISGEVCINEAAADPDGGAFLVNKELFAFPEVFGPLWGTIVGFGVMENKKAGGGDIPTHWGRVTTPLETKEGRIPLFRLGGFESTLR